jgi:phospholipid/cholesterol/gamma-HCH transport system substrate-binding protein
MFARKIKVQIVVFLVIAVVGITYTGAEYVGLGRLFGNSGYQVTLQLADSGGIFTNAEVTYRGVPVGRVGQLHLDDAGVAVDLDIDPDAPPIPAGSRAVVADRSAVGEQYVDLEPQVRGGPMLGEGSVIPVERTALPPAPDNVLSNLDKLVASVPNDSLRTVVDESHAAFDGTGPGLQKLLDSTNSLTSTATQHLPQTRGLLTNGGTALRTQAQDAGRIDQFSSGLNQITGQLKRSDRDLRGVINAAPRVGEQIDDVLRTSGPQMGVLTANLLSTTQIISARKDGLEQMLVELPVMTAYVPGMADANDTGHLTYNFNFDDPMTCTKGYGGTKHRPADDTTNIPVNHNAHCAEPPNSPTGVRGSQNAPKGPPPVAVAPPAAPAFGQPPTPAGPAAPAEARPVPGLGRDPLPGPIEFLDPGGSPRNLAQLLGLPG